MATYSADGYAWQQEHEGIIERLAWTNAFESDWTELKHIIKYKLTDNVNDFLRDDAHPSTSTPKPIHSSLPNSSPSTVIGPPTPNKGNLIIPPFRPRAPDEQASVKALPVRMSREESTTAQEKLFSMLDEFEDEPPYTIQRLAELVIRPREHYSTLGKYLRAVERTLLVTSVYSDFVLDTYALDSSNSTASTASRDALYHATTPLFSPIPFHPANQTLGGANSASNSLGDVPPSPLALDERKPLPGDDPSDENIPPRPLSRPLMVDELDYDDAASSTSSATNVTDISASNSPTAQLSSSLPEVGGSTAHLADRPESFSATTTGVARASSPPSSASLSPTSTRTQSFGAAGQSLSPGRISGTREAEGIALRNRFVRSTTPEPDSARIKEEVKREQKEKEGEEVAPSGKLEEDIVMTE